MKDQLPKGRCNYGVDLWYNQKSSHPKFYIRFFIDNSNANISLYALSCPNFNLGQLKVAIHILIRTYIHTYTCVQVATRCSECRMAAATLIFDQRAVVHRRINRLVVVGICPAEDARG